MSAEADFETMLRRALSPVEPPERLSERLEGTLADLHGMAAEELEAWELAAMRDPRNWARPAAAVVVGATTTTALVLLRTRRRSKGRLAAASDPLDLAERTLRDLAHEARRLIR